MKDCTDPKKEIMASTDNICVNDFDCCLSGVQCTVCLYHKVSAQLVLRARNHKTIVNSDC